MSEYQLDYPNKFKGLQTRRNIKSANYFNKIYNKNKHHLHKLIHENTLIAKFQNKKSCHELFIIRTLLETQKIQRVPNRISNYKILQLL